MRSAAESFGSWPDLAHGGEGVAADVAGNVFGAENVGKGLRKYAKQ